MSHWPLLSLVTFLPLVGAAFIMMVRGDEAVVARNARNIALGTSRGKPSARALPGTGLGVLRSDTDMSSAAVRP